MSLQLSRVHQAGELALHCEVENFLLLMYTTEDIIPQAYINITNFKQPVRQNGINYWQALWKIVLKFRPFLTSTVWKELLSKSWDTLFDGPYKIIGLRTNWHRYMNSHNSHFPSPIYSRTRETEFETIFKTKTEKRAQSSWSQYYDFRIRLKLLDPCRLPKWWDAHAEAVACHIRQIRP